MVAHRLLPIETVSAASSLRVTRRSIFALNVNDQKISIRGCVQSYSGALWIVGSLRTGAAVLRVGFPRPIKRGHYVFRSNLECRFSP